MTADPRGQLDYFDREDDAYFDWQTRPGPFAGSEAELLALTRLPREGRVVEIGCGQGGNLVHLGALPGWIGVDVAQGPLRQAARRLPGTHFVCADAQRLPFADGIAQAVLIRDVLHHVPDRGAVLREARRLLVPGGRLGLIEPNRTSPMILAQALLVPAERGVLVSTAERMTEELALAGFAQVEVERAQPLPLARLFHPRLKLDRLARTPLVSRALAAASKVAEKAMPAPAWMYLVGRATA